MLEKFGGKMKANPINIALVLGISILLAWSGSAHAWPSDLASTTNIFLYPKPYKMADLALKNCTGKMVSLRDYRGKVVLLHFWSIRCPACRMEEPLLQALKKSFGPAGLEILGVNLVDPPAAVISHAARHRIPYPVLFDGGRGFNLQAVTVGRKRTAFLVNPANEAILEVPGFPTTYVIDCRGNVVGYSIGPARWNHRNAVAFIQKLVAQTRTCHNESRLYSKLYAMGRLF